MPLHRFAVPLPIKDGEEKRNSPPYAKRGEGDPEGVEGFLTFLEP